MINVICGENSSSSRNYYLQLKKQFLDKDYEINFIKSTEINRLLQDKAGELSLFEKKIVYFSESLNKIISKKKSPAFYGIVESISKSKEIDLYIWEDGLSSRFLKYAELAKVKEFKLNESIFKLLDSCYPNNLKNFVFMLEKVSEGNEQYFIFIMLMRHIRNLLQASLNINSSKLQSWQVIKLKQQLNFWNKNVLLDFYDGLFRIDVLTKTNSTPFDIKKSVELLACYYL